MMECNNTTVPDILAKAVDRLAWRKTSASSAHNPLKATTLSSQSTDDDDDYDDGVVELCSLI